MEELEGIVQRMIDAGEPEENIKLVIEEFTSREKNKEVDLGKPEAVQDAAPVTAEGEAVDTDLASGSGLSELQEPKSKTYLPQIEAFEEYDIDAFQMTQPVFTAESTQPLGVLSGEQAMGEIKYQEEVSDAADKIMSGIQDMDVNLLESQNEQLKSSIESSDFTLSTRGLSQPEIKRAKENIKNKKTSILKNDILISNKLIEDNNIEDAFLKYESITDDFSSLTGRERDTYKALYYNVEDAFNKKIDNSISELNLADYTEIDFSGIQRADIEKVNEFASNLAKQYLPEGVRVETSNVYRTAYEKLKSKAEELRYIEPTKKAAKEDPKYEPLIEKIGEDKWNNFVETSSEAKVLIEQKDSIFNNVQSELNEKLDSYYKNNVVLSIKNYEDKLKQDVYNRVISVEEANEKLNLYQTQQINKYNLVEEDYSKKANELLQEKTALINKDIDVLYKSFQEEYNIPYQDLDALNKIYSDAYKKTIEFEGAILKIQEGFSEAIGGKTYMAISNFGKSFNESFSRSISSAGILLNQPSMVTFGDELATSFSIAPDKLENFSDLLDLSKVSKSTGRLAGSAATSIAVSSLVGAATGGLGVVPALAITSAAGMMTETMDMAGTMYRDVLAQTGSIDKANKARDEIVKAQMGNWYLYTFDGLPFVGKALRGIKRTGGRVLLAGGAESITETAQEIPQTAQEETITERALSGEEITADGWFEKVTPKLTKETFLEVSPGSFFMGGGGRVMTEALQSGKKNKFVNELMANYAISNVQESDEFLKQKIVNSISRFGKDFTTSWVTTLKQTGKFGDEKAFSDAIRYINNANSLINSPTYSKLDSKNQSIYAYFLNEYETKKQEAELSKDPISQINAKDAKNQLDNFISFVRPASFIERSLGEKREAKKPGFSYVEVQLGDRDAMIMSGEQLIKMTEENPDAFRTDLGLDLKVNINNDPELTEQFNERFDAINDLVKEPVIAETAPAEVEKLRTEEQAEMLEQIPSAENALTDGKVDREKITTEEGKAKFDEIYSKYDEKISPLLETAPVEEQAEISQEERKESAELRKEGQQEEVDSELNSYSGIFSKETTGLTSIDDIAFADGEMKGYFTFYKGVESDVVMMSPDEYLRMVREGFGTENDENILESSRKSIDKGVQSGDKIDMPYISYNEEGKMTGQEGRNRATYAKSKGESLIPVVIQRDISFEDKKSIATNEIAEAVKNGASNKDEVFDYIEKNKGLHRDKRGFIDRNIDVDLVIKRNKPSETDQEQIGAETTQEKPKPKKRGKTKIQKAIDEFVDKKIPSTDKVSMSEKQALNKQIRDFARGVREAYKDQSNFKKKVNKLISDNFKLYGNLTPSKVIALTRIALEVSSSKPKSLDKFIDYAAKLEQMTEDNVRKDILKRVIRNIAPKKLKKTVGGVLKGKIANYEGKVLSSIRNAIKEDSVESLQNSIDELENKQAQGIKLSEKEIFLLQVAKISNNLLSGDLKKTLEAEAKIEALIEDGKSKYREDIQKRATEYERLVIESLPAITGGKKLTDQFGKLEQGAKRRPLTEVIREKLSGFLDYGEGLRTLLDKIDRTAQRDESGYGGVLDKELYEPVADGRREKDSLDTSKINELSDKLTKLYGKKKKKALRDNQRPKNLGTFTDRKGNEVKLFLSQNQAYPLYQYMQDPSNMATFESMGFTDEMLQAVEDFLTPEIKEWADWQMSEFFPKYYDQINAVYKDMNDIDLPKQKIYVPIIRNLEGFNEKEVGVDEITFGNPQSTYKSLKQRQSSKAPFDMTKDGNEKLMEYTEGMNRYIAFAKPVKKLNVVFKNKDVRNAIREFNSTETLKAIDGFIERIANNSSNLGQRIALLDKIRGNVTIASLALAPTVTIKQLTSIPAYAADIPISKFISGLGAFAKNPKKVADILMESEYMQKRYKDGFERDILDGMKRDYDSMLKGTSNLKNKMMFLIKWGDKGAILMGGYSVYKYHFDKSRAEGKSIGESKKIALSKFEEATKLSQQSTNPEDLSQFQSMGSLGKLFTMYMTSPISYFRQERKSARDFVKGYQFGNKKLMRNAVKRFTIYHFVLPLVFQYVASGLPGLLTDWDEEDEKDLMRAASIGSLNGVFIAGQLISYFGDILTDKAWVRGGKFSPSPAFDAIVNIMNQSEDVISEWNKNPNKFSDDLMKEMIDLGFSVDVAVGLPVNRVKKLIENWKTIADDNDLETREKIALGLGFSPYVVTPKKKSKKDSASESERRDTRRDTRRSSSRSSRRSSRRN